MLANRSNKIKDMQPKEVTGYWINPSQKSPKKTTETIQKVNFASFEKVIKYTHYS